MIPPEVGKYFLPKRPNNKKQASGIIGINAIKIGLLI